MILIDPRSGSQNYIEPLRSLGAPVEVVTLEFGDVTFFGSGRAIGIELKKLSDYLQCLVTGRYAGHQLPGMCEHYDEVYLIVEGLWRPNPIDGVLETRRGKDWTPVTLGKRKYQYRDLDNALSTLDVKGGVRVKRSTTENETARQVYGLYNWWQDVDAHRSHLALNRSGRDEAIFTRPTLARRVAAELPNVGFTKSAMIVGKFPTVRSMVDATEKEWGAMPGIGKKMARQIVQSWDSEA